MCQSEPREGDIAVAARAHPIEPLQSPVTRKLVVDQAMEPLELVEKYICYTAAQHSERDQIF
jgi:hypothetical protein